MNENTEEPTAAHMTADEDSAPLATRANSDATLSAPPAKPDPIASGAKNAADPITVIASYAHIDDVYNGKVLDVMQRLRRDGGIDAWSDHFVDFPANGWPAWMRQQLRDRRWVLVFASEPYLRRAEGKEDQGRGLGVIWEHGYIRTQLYENQRINERFVPVGFGADQRRFVPADLRDYTYFDLDSEADFVKLLAVLAGSPLVTPHPLGRPAATTDDTNSPSASVAPADGAPAEPPAAQTQTLPRASTVFFSRRFTKAFPGVRGIRRFSQPTANERLLKLLEQPLSIPTKNGSIDPIWFWGRGDLYINNFDVFPGGIALMDVYELDIEEVAAVNSGSYYQQFVYVKARPSEPTGVHSDYSYVEDMERDFGEATEECGLYQGHYITRAEYDDGAAVIDSKLVDVSDSVELRVRHLTPTNFIIAAQNAPIAERTFDGTREQLLNDVLKGKKTLEELVEAVLALPKRQPLRYEYEED
jgi:hypothetical protein